MAGFNLTVTDIQATRPVSSPEHRALVRYPEQVIRILARSSAPAEVGVSLDISVEVPQDAAASDVFRIVTSDPSLRSEFAVCDLLPDRSIGADIQLTLFATELLGASLQTLEYICRRSIRKKGYTLPFEDTKEMQVATPST